MGRRLCGGRRVTTAAVITGIAGLLGIAGCGSSYGGDNGYSSLNCTVRHGCYPRPTPPDTLEPAPAAAPGWKGWPGAPAAVSLTPAVHGTLVAPYGHHYMSLGVSADGSQLVTVDSGGRVTRRPLAGGAATQLHTAPAEVVNNVDSDAWTAAVSPDLQTLAISGGDEVKIQQAASGAFRGEIDVATLPLARAADLAFSQDGKWLAFVDKKGDAHLVDLATGSARLLATPGKVPELGEGLAESLAFSPDGATLAAGTTDGYIDLWSVAAGTLTAALADPQEQAGGDSFAPGVDSMAFAENGALLAAADDDGNVYMWNVARRTVLGALSGTPALGGLASFSVAVSPDGRLLAVSFANGTIDVWSMSTGNRLASLHSGEALLNGELAFGLGGSLLAGLNNGGGITEWKL